MNLRTAVASLPPLLDTVRADLGLSGTAAGVLTALPIGATLSGARQEVIPDSITVMRVMQKGQVTIPLDVRRAPGIEAGTDVTFALDRNGARLVVEPARAEREIKRLRGKGDVAMTTDEILALTRA